MRKRIVQVVVGLPVEGPFDYEVDPDFAGSVVVGVRVRIMFNRKKRVGFVVGFKAKSAFKRLNPVLAVLDEKPSISTTTLKLTRVFAERYGCTWGEAIETWLLPVMRKDKVFNFSIENDQASLKDEGRIILLHNHDRKEGWVFLRERIKNILAKKRNVILLVPENAQAKAVRLELKEFAAVLVFAGKAKTAKIQVGFWQKVKEMDEALVVGTRSSVFAPIERLGLIVVLDEENELYKEEQTPHYHALEVALMRRYLEKCDVIVASCAPRAETWWQAKKEKWEMVSFKKPGAGVQIVDMNNYNPRRSSILSFPLQNTINTCLKEKKKVLIFLNRRGFSTMTRCNQCGYIVKCPRCNVNLTFMYSKNAMVCRHCDHATELPKKCPSCKGHYLRSVGVGEERVESELSRLYQHADVQGYNKDTKIFPRKADIVIATQAVLKLVDELNVDTAAVLDFDAELFHFDFRSAHKAFALLTHLQQMSRSRMIVQTRMMDNYTIRALRKPDFDYFYRQELKYRKELKLPPFNNLIEIGLRGEKEENVFAVSNDVFKKLEENKGRRFELVDPHPDTVPKKRDKFRYSILLKGKALKPMHRLIKKSVKEVKSKKGVNITTNVNP